MRALRVAALLLAVPNQAETRLTWVPNPRTTNGSWVADPAHHLSAQTVVNLNTTISALERTNGSEIAVVVIDSLDGLDPSAAALRIHRLWGVGKKDRDNGLVVLWCPACRQTFVSVGDGLEGVLPDAKVGRIQDEYMIPAFRAGNFDDGMLATVQALADVARGEQFVGPKRIRLEPPGFMSNPKTWFIGGPIALVLFGTFGVWGLAAWNRRRPRKCPNGHGRMVRLTETLDDKFLDEGQRAEETVGSVDYDVWACPQCDATIVLPYKKLFTSYKQCPKCSRITLRVTTTITQQPTYASAGLGKQKRTCRNCKYEDEKVVVLPRLQRSSGGGGGSSFGGGGGGSSFGGGSSSGGGAGRSY